MERETSRYYKPIVAFLGAVALFIFSVWSVSAALPEEIGDEPCLACHSNKQMTMYSTSGESISIFVDKDVLNKSVHGKQLSCTSCHTDIAGYPHPKRTISDRRSYAIERYALCKTCHSVVYQKALDSVHATILNTVNQNAPICTDCHGYHDVINPDTPRTKVSTTCSKCHKPINDNYVSSVHGKALIEENNTDVPVCTDCHGIHNIKAANNPAFRIESPEICAGCHTNKPLMDKYGISSEVYQTFRKEFHGMTAELYRANLPTIIWRYKAVCIDCHGIHNIKQPEDPSSSVNPANLVQTCGKCHEGSSESFTQAWTEHSNPTPEKGFAIWAVQVAYMFLIPATLGGMVIHIGFERYRARQRVRKERENEPY